MECGEKPIFCDVLLSSEEIAWVSHHGNGVPYAFLLDTEKVINRNTKLLIIKTKDDHPW